MLQSAMPAVVNVVAETTTEGTVDLSSSNAPNSDEEENDETSGEEDNATNNPNSSGPNTPPSSRHNPKGGMMDKIGSGVIFNAAKGLIMTNAHLIRGSNNVTVNLNDGRHFKARIIGIDNGSDVAVLQIQADKLSALPLGNSDKLNVGDVVIAIGNPFGLNRFGPTSTATAGIVSALNRSGMDIESYENFIQTDASINMGNSGGALVNTKGELVGINTAIFAPSGGSIGIGFAIPINMANNIAQQLIKYGAVRRGLMGVLVQPLTPELAQSFGSPNLKGALVSSVNPESPAEKAGLKAGDVITEMNLQKIDNASQVRNTVGLLRVGDEVRLKVFRDGKNLDMATKIIDPRKHEEEKQTQQSFIFGIALKDYAEESPYHGLIQGVQITGLMQNSVAWRSGLRPGDIVTSINRHAIKSTQELKELVKKNHDQQALLFHILRGPGAAFIVVK